MLVNASRTNFVPNTLKIGEDSKKTHEKLFDHYVFAIFPRSELLDRYSQRKNGRQKKYDARENSTIRISLRRHGNFSSVSLEKGFAQTVTRGYTRWCLLIILKETITSRTTSDTDDPHCAFQYIVRTSHLLCSLPSSFQAVKSSRKNIFNSCISFFFFLYILFVLHTLAAPTIIVFN